MRSRRLTILAALSAVLVLIATGVVSVATPENASAYDKSQAASQTSACGNEFMPMNAGSVPGHRLTNSR